MDGQTAANHLKDTPKSFLEMFIRSMPKMCMVTIGVTVSMGFGSIFNPAST